MDTRKKRILIIAIIVFIIGSIAGIVYYMVTPRLPSTQDSTKTVIIDNYSDYTGHISSNSFGTLGNYLYRFIQKPSQGVYHATIVDKSYTYAPDSWFSNFIVKLTDSDISWKVSMQTLDNGDINGDISIVCNSGGVACLSLSDTLDSKTTLQALLPINTPDYIIATQKNDYNGLSIIYYDQEGTGKTKALENIKSLGFKPEDYSITYYYGGH
ncbi:MAG: hypothetical protein JWN12_458 [Candidatus Saccharibacteria bacterium]|nr:hypothetical protein [Candidatus Saccharibacteria bacterium]